jgi:hypothetical protein
MTVAAQGYQPIFVNRLHDSLRRPHLAIRRDYEGSDSQQTTGRSQDPFFFEMHSGNPIRAIISRPFQKAPVTNGQYRYDCWLILLDIGDFPPGREPNAGQTS